MKVFLSVAGMLLCAQVAADEIDLSFNTDAVRLVYKHALQANNLETEGGWLHDKDAGDVVHIGLNLASEASESATPVRAGLGGRLAYFNGDRHNQSGEALAIGGFVRYTVPQYNRIILGGQVYFAPDVLSFSHAKQFVDSRVRISYNVMREADVYLGARYVKGKFDKAKHARFDTGLHIGIDLRF